MSDIRSNTYLTEVEPVNLEDLDPEFIFKDTEIVGGWHYPLPDKGKYMILWLFTTDGLKAHRWQTIRRWTSEKENYYRSHINELVKIKIEEQEP
jgi:hypothetical protein